MQKSQSLFYLTIAPHVSGVTITHLQEHKELKLQHLVSVMCAYFVVPDCCASFINFSFVVFILVDFVCLLGINKFNVH